MAIRDRFIDGMSHAASTHPLAGQASIALQHLAAEPMVLLDIPPSRDYFTSLFVEVGLAPTIRYYSPSFEMVRGMVGNGLGYALSPNRRTA